MKQINPFSDQRHDEMCSYCGKLNPETRDHVPSKSLLDDPFPDNLPVVSCCTKCNQDFSLDELYFACSIECVLCVTGDIEKLKRQKIISSLKKRPSLQKKIESSFTYQNGQIYFKYDQASFTNVAIKLAKGHVKYELSEPRLDYPSSISIMPLMSMSEHETDIFFASSDLTFLPEVGSRSLQNLLKSDSIQKQSQWTIVQDNNYKYSVIDDAGVLIVRIVVWDYLAIEVIWEEEYD